MNCTDPEIGNLLWDYQFDLLSDEERKRFESHLLSCDYCFQEAYVLMPVVEQIKANPQTYLEILSQPAPPGMWRRLNTRWQEFMDTLRNVPQIVRWGLGGAAVVATLFIAFFVFRGPTELSGLARIEPYPFHSLSAMGAPGRTEAETHFLQGMQSYSKGDYKNGLPELQQAVTLDSTDAEFQFFLGLTYLLLRDARSAIRPLEASIALNPDRYEARARWYLGNAYLLLGDGEKVLDEFGAVSDLKEEYAHQAQELLQRLKSILKKNDR